MRREETAAGIDVAIVGYVSLGIYGDAVARPSYRNAKLPTLLDTAREALGPSAPTRGLRLIDDLGREHRDPAVALVSNNPYAVGQPVMAGTRPSLPAACSGSSSSTRPVASLTRASGRGARRAPR